MNHALNYFKKAVSLGHDIKDAYKLTAQKFGAERANIAKEFFFSMG